MTTDPTPAAEREEVVLRITLGNEGGIIVWSGDTPCCGFSTAADLCLWLESVLRQFDPVTEASPSPPRGIRSPDAPKPLRSRIFGVVSGDGGKA